MPKELRPVAAAAQRAGWTITYGGTGHLRWRNPNGGVITTASTPKKRHGNWNTVRAAKADLRRAGLEVLHRSHDMVLSNQEVKKPGKWRASMPSDSSWAILDSHTKMNPSSPADAEFYDAGQTAYILQRPSGSRIVATSFGGRSEELYVRSTHEFHHDQSGRSMGELLVLGAVSFSDTSYTEGEIPEQKLPHFVFK